METVSEEDRKRINAFKTLGLTIGHMIHYEVYDADKKPVKWQIGHIVDVVGDYIHIDTGNGLLVKRLDEFHNLIDNSWTFLDEDTLKRALAELE